MPNNVAHPGGQFLSSYRWAHTRVRHPFPGGFHPFIVQALLLGRILFPAKSAWNRDSWQHTVEERLGVGVFDHVHVTGTRPSISVKQTQGRVQDLLPAKEV